MKLKTILAACMILCGLTVVLVVPAVVHADNGHQDGAYTAGTSGAPTTSKPESKVWFSHKKWWAVMARKIATGGNTYFIFRLNVRTQKWVNTHVAVDTRDNTRQDVLSVGSKLFIASHKHVDVAHRDTSPDPKRRDAALPLQLQLGGAQVRLRRGTDGDRRPEERDPRHRPRLDRSHLGDVGAGEGWRSAPGLREADGRQLRRSTSRTAPSAGGPSTLPEVSPDDISSVVHFGGNKWASCGAIRGT